MKSRNALLHLFVIRRVARLPLGVVGSVSGSDWIVLGGAWHFASELLEGLSLGLWNKESCQETEEHEEGENLNDVVEPWACVGCCGATSTEGSNKDLGNDGPDLASSSGHTVGSRPVTSREALARDDEGGSVRTWYTISTCCFGLNEDFTHQS